MTLESIERFLDCENDSRTKKPTLMRVVTVKEVDKGYADILVEPMAASDGDETEASASLRSAHKDGRARIRAGQRTGDAVFYTVVDLKAEEGRVILRSDATAIGALRKDLELEFFEKKFDTKHYRVCFEKSKIDVAEACGAFQMPSIVAHADLLGLLSGVVLPSRLRVAQRSAFDLLAYDRAVLWGPPGTGKTTTISALVRTLLQIKPGAKILMLAPTNSAIDTLMGRILADDPRMSRKIRRLGPEPNPDVYEKFPEVLNLDPSGMSKVLESHAKTKRFGLGRVRALEVLKAGFRERTKQSLKTGPRVIGTTVANLYFEDEITNLAPFDWIIVDEASQVRLMDAVFVSKLGRSIIYCGDPKQLSPVVKSDQAVTKFWGASVLDSMKIDGAAGNTKYVFLNEQSRMEPFTCKLVSEAYYRGALKVCEKASGDITWKAERRAILGDSGPTLIKVEGQWKWSRRYGGSIREASAEGIVRLYQMLLNRGVRPEDCAVITAFHAQIRRIQSIAKKQGLELPHIGTVHSFQGKEVRVVIADPVSIKQCCKAFARWDGETKKETERLLNVAFSRTIAQLFVFVDAEDEKHDLIRAIRGAFSRCMTDELIGKPSHSDKPVAAITVGKMPNLNPNEKPAPRRVADAEAEVGPNGALLVRQAIDGGRRRTLVAAKPKQKRPEPLRVYKKPEAQAVFVPPEKEGFILPERPVVVVPSNPGNIFRPGGGR